MDFCGVLQLVEQSEQAKDGDTVLEWLAGGRGRAPTPSKIKNSLICSCCRYNQRFTYIRYTYNLYETYLKNTYDVYNKYVQHMFYIFITSLLHMPCLRFTYLYLHRHNFQLLIYSVLKRSSFCNVPAISPVHHQKAKSAVLPVSIQGQAHERLCQRPD